MSIKPSDMDNMLNDNNEWKVGATAVLFRLEPIKNLRTIGFIKDGTGYENPYSNDRGEHVYIPVWIDKIQKVGKNGVVKYHWEAYKIDRTGEKADRYHEYSRNLDESQKLDFDRFIKLASGSELKKYEKEIERYKMTLYKWDHPWEFKEKPDPWEIPDKK